MVSIEVERNPLGHPPIPLKINAICRRSSLDIFGHVLDMDLNFHLHRKTGEMLRIMDRGRWGQGSCGGAACVRQDVVGVIPG